VTHLEIVFHQERFSQCLPKPKSYGTYEYILTVHNWRNEWHFRLDIT